MKYATFLYSYNWFDYINTYLDGGMKIKTVISLIVIIIMLFLARSMYSNHNLEKIFNACVLGKAKNFSVEEAKKICTEKIK